MAMIALGLHGGCGTLDRSMLSEAEWQESREHIAAALRAGWAVLNAGGSAVEAVEATIIVLEDSPHFNAGHGAALTEASQHELDASIMDGATLEAGAICSVRRIRNPIKAARAVMNSGRAVLLSGVAADAFAERQGLAMVEQDYFRTERRVEALSAIKARAAAGTLAGASEAEKHGTVGAVARDADGHLAAGTSTGGYTNKPEGRVGDSPIIGAGTYAKDGVCAVSGTGMGEIFIRRVAAYDVAARIQYAGQTLQQAANEVVFKTLSSHKIGAGMIALGPEGVPVAPFNTLGMYRGWVDADGDIIVATHQDLYQGGRA